jgi:predicted dehydrogenase
VVTQPLRFGILGSGSVAHGFAAGLAAADGAELAAVASRHAERASAFAARHDGVRVHASYDDLLGDPDVDVVYVATPNHRHADDTVACLEHGKAVLCEKPFTTSAVQARRVVEAARSHGVFCMEAMWMRFVPAVRRVAEVVRSGTIGEVQTLHADFSHPVVVEAGSRLFDPAQGGGALLDLGVYTVSLAQMLLGEPSAIVARLAIGATGVDEHASLVAAYTSGGLATLTSSLRTLGPNQAVIAGSTGRIVVPGPICAPTELVVERVRAAPAGSGAETERPLRRIVASRPRLERSARSIVQLGRRVARQPGRSRMPLRANGYEYEIDEVVRCLREGLLESPMMSLEESVRVMEVIDLARANAKGPSVES